MDIEMIQQQMFDADTVMRGFGARLLSAEPGKATLVMTVLDSMMQGHGTCHGGVLFALADAAFGVACNTARYPAVAQHCSISFLQSAKLGDELSVTVERRSESGRTGVYDGSIVTKTGNLIAEFRGISRSLPLRKPDN